MSHDIANIDGKDAVFTVGQKPWHRLGVTVETAPTAEEAIELAGLDWGVKKAPASILIDGEYHSVPERFGLARVEKSGKVVPFPNMGQSNIYTIVQNKEAFSFFDAMVENHLVSYETAGALGIGEKVWIMAKANDSFSIGPNDEIEKYMLLSNQHGTGALEVMFTPVRVVCANTLAAAMNSNSGRVKLRHTTSIADRLEQASVVIQKQLEYFKDVAELYGEFRKIRMGTQEQSEFVRQLFPAKDETDIPTRTENNRSEVLRLAEVGKGQDIAGVRGTLWGLFNGVTEYADFNQGTRVKKGQSREDKKLESIWYGSSAALKQKAFDLAITYLN